MAKKRIPTSKPPVELDLTDLDQVVGGATTPAPPARPANDHSQDQAFLATLGNVAAAVSTAAADINANSSHAAADIKTVEAASAGYGSTDAALTALLGATHGNAAVATELSTRLANGTAETDIVSKVMMGQSLSVNNAMLTINTAVQTLAAYSADGDTALGMSQHAALSVVESKLDATAHGSAQTVYVQNLQSTLEGGAHAGELAAATRITHDVGGATALAAGITAAISHLGQAESATAFGQTATAADLAQSVASGAIAAAAAIGTIEADAAMAHVSADQGLVFLDKSLGSNAAVEAEMTARLAGGAAAIDLAAAIHAGTITTAGAIAEVQAEATQAHGSTVAGLAGLYAALNADATVQGTLVGLVATAADASAAIKAIEATAALNHTSTDAMLLALDKAFTGGNATIEAEMLVRLSNGAAANDMAAVVHAGTMTTANALAMIQSEASQAHGSPVAAVGGLYAALNGDATVQGTLVGLVKTAADVTAAVQTIQTVAALNHTSAGTMLLPLLTGIAANASTAVQVAAGSQFAALIQANAITASQMMTAMNGAVVARTLTGDQAVALLTGLASAQVFSVTSDIQWLINSGYVSPPQMTTDIGNFVTAKVLTGDQAVSILAGFWGASANAVVQAAVAAEIVALINGNSVTAANAMADLGSTVTTHAVSGTTVLSILAAIAGNANAAVTLQAAVGSEIAALINISAVTASQTMTAIGSAVTAHTLTGDRAIAVLAGIAASGPAAVTTAAAGEIVTLINTNVVTAAQTMTDIGSAVSSKALTGDQAIVVLAGLAATGSAAVQAAAAGQILSLMNTNAVTASQAMTDIGSAVTGRTLTGDQAVAVLAGVAAAGSAAVQAAAAGEIVALINSNSVAVANAMADIGAAVTGAQALTILTGIAGNATASAAIEVAAGRELGALIASNAITASQTMTALGTAVTAHALTGDQAIAVLAGIAASGPAAAVVAATSEIVSLINANAITAAQTMTDLGNAVTAKTLTGDQVVLVLAGIANSPVAATQAAVAGEIVALINANAVTAAHAMTDIGAAVTAAALTGAHALALLTAVAAAGTSATRLAVGNELAALIGMNAVAASSVMATIQSAVINKSLTADQAVLVLAAGAGSGTAAVQAAVSTEFGSLLTSLSISTANLATDLVSAVAAKALTGDQAVATLTTLGYQPAAAGIVTLINNNVVTATAAVADIAVLVKSSALRADYAIGLLTTMSMTASGAVQAAAGGAIAAIIAAGSVTAQALRLQITSYPLSATNDQAVAILATVAAQATTAVKIDVINQIISLAQLAPNNIAADIANAVASKALTADQAIPILAVLVGSAAQNTLAPLTGELLTLVNSNAVTPAQAIADIDSAVTTNVLNGSSAVLALAQLAGSGVAAVQTAAANEIFALVGSNSVTAADAIQGVERAVQFGGLPGVQAMPVLAGMAGSGNPSFQVAAGVAVADLCGVGLLTASQAISAIDGAVTSTSKALTGDQALVMLAAVAGERTPDVAAAAVAEIASLVSRQYVSAASVIPDIDAAVRLPSQGLMGDTAVKALAGLAGAGIVSAADAAREILSLVNSNFVAPTNAVADIDHAVQFATVPAVQAVAIMASLDVGGPAALQAAASQEIAGLINRNLISAAAAANAVMSTIENNALLFLADAAAGGPAALQTATGNLVGSLIGNNCVTVDQAVAILADLVLNGIAVVQTAAAVEIGSLISSNSTALLNDIGGAVASQALTGDQAMAVLARVAANGSMAVQNAAIGEMTLLVTSNSVAASNAMADIAGALRADQAVTLLAEVAASAVTTAPTAPDAVRAALYTLDRAAISEIALLIGNNAITPAQAMADIGNLVTANALTVGQAIAVMGGVAGAGSAAVQVAAGGEIAAFIGTGSNQISADTALAAAMLQGSLPFAQAVLLLAGVALNGTSTTQAAVAAQLVHLCTVDGIAFLAAPAGIVNAVTSGALTGAQAISILVDLAASWTGSAQTAAGGEIGYLINNNNSVAGPAIAAIDAAVNVSGTLNGTQAIAMLVGMIGMGGAAQSAAGTELASLIGPVIPASQAMTIIAGAGFDAAIPVLAVVAATGTATEQSAAMAQMAALVNGGTSATGVALNAAQKAMDDIVKLAVTDTLTGDQAVSIMLGLAGQVGPAANGPVMAHVGCEIVALSSGNSLIATHAITAIANAVALPSHALTGDQAVAVLAAIAANGNPVIQTAAIGQMASIINNNTVTFSQAMQDIAAVVTATSGADGFLNSLQRCAVMANVAAALIAANPANANSVITTLVAGANREDGASSKEILIDVLAVLNFSLGANTTVQGMLAANVGAITSTDSIPEIEIIASLNHLPADGVLLGLDKAVGGNAAVEAELTTRLTNGATVADLVACLKAGVINAAQAIAIIDGVAQQVHASALDTMIPEMGIRISAGMVTSADALSQVEELATAQNVSLDLALSRLAMADPNDLTILDPLAERLTATGTSIGADMNSTVYDLTSRVASGNLTTAAALQVIDDALKLVQNAGPGLQPALLPGVVQTEVLLGNLSTWVSGLVAAASAPSTDPMHAALQELETSLGVQVPVSSIVQNLGALADALNAQYGVAISIGQALDPLVDNLGQSLAVSAVETGAQLITPAAINDANAQTQLLQGLMSTAQAGNVSTDAALALASFGAAGQSQLLNTVMTARLLGGAAEAEIASLIIGGNLSAAEGLGILTGEVRAISAGNANQSALGFDQATAVGVVTAKLDMAAAAIYSSEEALIHSPANANESVENQEAEELDDLYVSPTHTANAGAAVALQKALESAHPADVVTGLGAVLGLLGGAPSDPAGQTQVQIAAQILNDLLPAQVANGLAAMCADGQPKGQDELNASVQDTVASFQSAFMRGNYLCGFITQLESKTVSGQLTELKNGQWETIEGPSGGSEAASTAASGYSATLTLYDFYQTSGSVDTNRLVQSAWGNGIVGYASVDANASGSAGVYATAVTASGTAGAMASVGINFGNNVQLQGFVQALASGSATVGVTGIQVSANLGVGAGVEISQTQTFGLGNGLSGAQTTTLEAQVGESLMANGQFGITGAGIAYGARMGAYVSVGEQARFDLGPAQVGVTGTLYSPGVVGYSMAGSIGLQGGTLSVNLDMFVGADLIGAELDLNFSIDVSGVPNMLESFGETLEYNANPSHW